MLPLVLNLLVTSISGAATYSGLSCLGEERINKKAKKANRVLKKLDQRYQRLMREHVDTLFDSRHREQQLEEFSGSYSQEETALNRRLGFSVLNTGFAVLGATVYPPFLILNALGLAYLIGPLTYEHLLGVWRNKRLSFRLIAALSIVANFAAGFYVIGSLFMNVVFLAFKLVARSEAQSRKALGNLFSLHTPDTVWVLVDGVEIETPFSQLRVGDILALNAGQVVPIDGHIVHGMATLDQQHLTGESQPIEKTTGDTILASTLVLSGKLHVRVEQTGTDTTAAHIADILNGAADYKLSVATRSEGLADKLTLPMLAASGLALMSIGMQGAVTVLNSGFGSTVFFAGPLSMLSYLNLISHHGILVKDGRSLEILHEVDTVVFDKTGTLTLNEPEVSMIHCVEGWQEDDILKLAATAEHRQPHPIARAILAAAERRELSYEQPVSGDYTLGFGLQVTTHDKRSVHVGSSRFMELQGIVIPEKIEREQARCAEQGCSLVMVAVDGVISGALEMQAQLRPEAISLIEQLHARGLKLSILSGDHDAPTRYLAQRLNIDDYFAEVLPEDKAAQIQSLQQAGRVVCFVGDGINDAIALQQADVSISMRGATTLATDSAQVVLTDNSLHQLSQLFELSDSFKRNLDNTLLLSFIPGSVLIAGVFLLHFGMGTALILYSAGLTGAIGNALYPMLQLKHNPDHTP